jgi:citrate lyase subunit beta/citryl-CoA lyase
MTMPAPAIPLRSVLFMPASNPRALEKARSLPCDAVAIDLEDAVAPDAKVAARAELIAQVRAGGFGHRRIIARINALSTPWGHDDLAALSAAPIDALLAPKIDSETDVATLSAAMDQAGYPAHVPLWVMIETPRAVVGIDRIAASSPVTRLTTLMLGLNDLAKDTGIAQVPGRAAFVPIMIQCVLSARSHGLTLLDGVCNAIDDPDRLADECTQARDLGMDGKTLIHPAQINTANHIFAPSPEAIAEAQALVTAFADPANAGKGALKVGGKMAELLHRDMAQRLLARAAAIAARG